MVALWIYKICTMTLQDLHSQHYKNCTMDFHKVFITNKEQLLCCFIFYKGYTDSRRGEKHNNQGEHNA